MDIIIGDYVTMEIIIDGCHYVVNEMVFVSVI